MSAAAVLKKFNPSFYKDFVSFPAEL